MKTVSVTEFRSNIKRYLDIAQEEKLVIHRSKGKSFAIVPLDELEEEEKTFHSETLQELIDQARKERKEGKTTRVTSKNLWDIL